MGGQGRQIGGLAFCLVGVIGACVACGLPMWRETSFVGANIVTAQSVWDGLWLHCVVQATGQMQCKRHTSALTLTSDIQAGRALMLMSIIIGLLGFLVTLLGGGVVNCSGAPPDHSLPQSTSSSSTKAVLLGGVMCVLSGILCLVSVSWSAGNTISVYNDPLVPSAMKREVGSSIYIGWVSSLLLLLGGALMCFVCKGKESPNPSNRTYMPFSYSSSSHVSDTSSRAGTVRADVIRQKNSGRGSNGGRLYDRNTPNSMVAHEAQVHKNNSMNKAGSWVGEYNQAQGTRPEPVRGSFDHNPPSRLGSIDQRRRLFMETQPNQGELVNGFPRRATSVPLEYY